MRSISYVEPIESFLVYGGIATASTFSSSRAISLSSMAQVSLVAGPPIATTALAASVVCAGAELIRAARHEPPEPRPLGAEPCPTVRWDPVSFTKFSKNAAVVGAQMLLAVAALQGLGVGWCLPVANIARYWLLAAIDISVCVCLKNVFSTLTERWFGRTEAAAIIALIATIVGSSLYLSSFQPVELSFLT